MIQTRAPLEPKLLERTEQPYVAIQREVAMADLAGIADDVPALFEWLTAHEVRPTGPPFFRYNVLTSSGGLDLEVGIPVEAPMRGDRRVLAGVLPGGRFASVTHLGHPSGLVDATAGLLDWGAEQHLDWDMSESDGGQRWGLRLEIYKTDPAIQPDMNAWETEILLRLADQTADLTRD
jgi:hypothetical protein